MFQVLAASTYSTLRPKQSTSAIVASFSSTPSAEAGDRESTTLKEEVQNEQQTRRLRFLDRSIVQPVHSWLQCTEQQVEEVKAVTRVLPIFMSTIMLNCCLAQLSTFSVQQSATMNTKLGSLKVLPASLPVFPVLFIMVLAPLYNHVIVTTARKITKTEMGITHLQRIGTGLILSIVAMAAAALVEIKRKNVAAKTGMLDSSEPLPITFLWVALQYAFLGSARKQSSNSGEDQ